MPGWALHLRDAGVAVEPIVKSHPRNYLGQLTAVESMFRRRRPSVGHTHGYHADVLAGFAARRSVIPTVSTVHGFVGGDWKNRLYEMVQRRALRRCDAVVAVSKAMGSALERAGVSTERLHVVPNAYEQDGEPLSRDDARARLGLPADAFRIGWIGRLSPEKGPDVMLRALGRLPEDDAHLSVVGDGPERSRLGALAADLGVAPRVSWHGVIAGAARLLKAFDVVVLSSRSEGTPVVLLEAMAAGTPVVATRVGGVPDVVSASEAILVEPGDDSALAAAVRAVRGDPRAAAARADAAKRRVLSEYGADPWLTRIDEVYAAAISNARSRRSR